MQLQCILHGNILLLEPRYEDLACDVSLSGKSDSSFFCFKTGTHVTWKGCTI